jgi:tetratricopeptide (TPR) repeat protein
MDFKFRKQLTDAFLACPIMSNRHSRDSVVSELPGNIPFSIPRNNIDRVDVANIVITCLRYSGGLEALVEAVRYFEGDSSGMQMVDEAVRTIPEEQFTKACLLSIKPFQAPAQVPYFVGRAVHIKTLRSYLKQPGSQQVVGLCGLGGVGKTVLAIHLAHAVRDVFADGVLWVDLEDTTSLESALLNMATAFGRAEEVGNLANLADRAAQVRQILASKHVLVVLDNVSKEDQVRHLLPSGPQAMTLVTTRDEELLSVIGALTHKVEPFLPDESLALLKRLIGTERLKDSIEVAKTLIDWVGGLPLALSIVGSYLQAYRHITLDKYRQLLNDETKRLSRLELQDRSVVATFNISYDALDKPVQHLFASLAVFAGANFGVDAVAAISGLEIVEVEMVHLTRLHALSMVEIAQKTPARYRLHTLLRHFAHRKLEADFHSEVDDLHRRAAAHFIDLARRYGQSEYGRLDSEWDNLSGTLQWAYEHQQWSILIEGVQALTAPGMVQLGFLDMRGYWEKARQWLAGIVENAKGVEEALFQTLLIKRAAFAGKQGDFAVVTTAAQRALMLLPDIATPARIDALTMLSNVAGMTGEREESLKYLRQAMEIAKVLGDRQRQANVLRKLGVEEAESEHFTTAVDYWSQALQLYWELERAGEAAHVCSNLGRLYTTVGNEEKAEDHLIAAIKLSGDYDLPELEAFAKTNMAKLRIQQRRLEEARLLLESAYQRCTELELSELTEVLGLQGELTLLLNGDIIYKEEEQ